MLEKNIPQNKHIIRLDGNDKHLKKSRLREADIQGLTFVQWPNRTLQNTSLHFGTPHTPSVSIS